MPLSYSSGYSSVRPTEIQQQQADPFATALQAVQERKKAQQERQQKLVQSREQFAKDDYYGMHADILRQASQQLIDREDDFARDDVSMQKYAEAWQNLSDMADMFKTYKANTYGSPEDDPSAATFLAAEKRSMGVDPFAADGFEASVGYDDMMRQLDSLNQPSEKMGVSLDENLEILIDGKPLIDTDFGTSNNPFDPGLKAADISGAKAFKSVWNARELTPDGIDANMRIHLENSDNMIKAVTHYIRTRQKENPDFNPSLQEVLENPDQRNEVVEQYIQEAQEYYETQAKEKKPDTDAERRAEKRKQFLDNIISTISSVPVKSDPELEDPDTSVAINSIVNMGGGMFVYVAADDDEIYVYYESEKVSYPIGAGAEGYATHKSKVARELNKYGLSIGELYDEMTK